MRGRPSSSDPPKIALQHHPPGTQPRRGRSCGMQGLGGGTDSCPPPVGPERRGGTERRPMAPCRHQVLRGLVNTGQQPREARWGEAGAGVRRYGTSASRSS